MDPMQGVDPLLNWQIYQNELDLRRELSQVTKRGTDFKPQEGSDASAAKCGTSSRSTPSLESDLDQLSQAYQQADVDASDSSDSTYEEFMRNLTPCSSRLTKISQVGDSIVYDETALDGLYNRQRILEGNEKVKEVDSKVPEEPYCCTKIELLESTTGQRFVLTLNDLVEYVHSELCEEIQQYKISRDKVIQCLTVNHLLIYILNNRILENLHYIDQVRLFHLGRSYKADRGISDPRYFTLQFYLADLKLDQSPCFHLFIAEHETDVQSEYYPSTAKKMLLKSFVWREIVRPVDISATYAEALVGKLKRVKSSMRIPSGASKVPEKLSQQKYKTGVKSKARLKIQFKRIFSELTHKVQKA